jgi:hypothetical protein
LIEAAQAHCTEAIGEDAAAAHARCSLGVVQAEFGRAEEAVATIRQALDASLAHGTSGDVARCHANLTATLLRVGAYDEVVRAGAEGLAYCGHAGFRACSGSM